MKLICFKRVTGLEVLCVLMESLGTRLRSSNEIVPARRLAHHLMTLWKAYGSIMTQLIPQLVNSQTDLF